MHWLEKYSQMKYFNVGNPLYQNHIIMILTRDKCNAKSIKGIYQEM